LAGGLPCAVSTAGYREEAAGCDDAVTGSEKPRIELKRIALDDNFDR
jgi:hypothetical protein